MEGNQTRAPSRWSRRIRARLSRQRSLALIKNVEQPIPTDNPTSPIPVYTEELQIPVTENSGDPPRAGMPGATKVPGLYDIDVEVGTAVDDCIKPSTSTTKPCSMEESNDNLNECFEEWNSLTDSLSDCDMELNDDAHLLPGASPRDAEKEPAFDTDLTPYEAAILHIEDKQNDLALKESLPPDCHNFEWKEDPQIFQATREKFIGTPGPTFPLTSQTPILEVFYKMVNTDLVDRICTETNRYAHQTLTMMQQQRRPWRYLSSWSMLYDWIPTDRDEMFNFLALTILQGLYPLPDEAGYFSYNGFGTMPYFRLIMSYDRYILLKQFIHFVDNKTIRKRSKLCKIQPIVDHFNEKFSSLYYPGQEIVINETLSKWLGRLRTPQKISQPPKVGLKTYELCEASSGYVWKFLVCVGNEMSRTTNYKRTVDDEPERTDESETTSGPVAGRSKERLNGATANIVYDLVKPLLHRGHTLVTDSIYNSPLLARCLKRQKTDCYGTLRLNRQYVPNSLKYLKKTDLQLGEIKARYCSDLSVCVWRNARLVSLISTYHMHMETEQKNHQLKYKPNIILDYNKTMGGLQRKDQDSSDLANQLLVRPRYKIWYKKLFYRIFNSAIYNAFLIFKSRNSKITYTQFRTRLAEDLLKVHCKIDLAYEQLVTPQFAPPELKMVNCKRRVQQNRHFPVRNNSERSRCWICAQRKVITKTKWKCLQCNTNLCIDSCFMEYHMQNPSIWHRALWQRSRNPHYST